MSSGLFILMDGEESVKQCINKGVYGFFMPPVFEDEVNSRSKHYAVLCDYGCCYEGTEIFFFTRRKVFYGGRITKSNGDNPVFYLNGNTSPMGRKSNSEMFVDLSNVQPTTEDEGVYYLGKNTRNEDRNRALPFVIEFETNELSGKQISSDDLYFELGKYNFPFPSNAIQKLAIVTLTPKGTYRERMSFRNLTLSEFEDSWEDSYWKLFFDETTILNILWKEPKSGSKNGERILEGVNRISFNDDDLDSIEKSYNMVKEAIEKEDVSLLPYPNSFENQILEIGPKGQKSDDAYNTFFNKDTTKTCFFLNKDILLEKKER